MVLTVSRRVVNRLADEIEMAGRAELIPERDATEIAQALRGSSSVISVRLVEPHKVSCTLRTELADLRYVRCTDRGHLHDLRRNPQILQNGRCPICQSPVVPAPVWAISTRRMRQQQRPSIYPNSGVPIVRSLDDYASVYGLGSVQRVFIEDFSRPIAGLRLEISSGVIREIYPLSIRFGRGLEHMLALAPTESITKPVTITAFAYNKRDCAFIEPTIKELNGVEEILFCRRLEVLQATVAYRAGNPRLSRRDRAVLLDYESNPSAGASEYKLYVRYLTTCGLVVRLNGDVLRDVAERVLVTHRRNPLWICLHTLSHAFLVRLPQATGLEGTDFCEALRTLPESDGCYEFAVYDNSMGGLGGIEGVVDEQNNTLDPNYEDHILSVAACPLDCISACKACLFTDSCYMLNWGLNRRILIQLEWVQ